MWRLRLSYALAMFVFASFMPACMSIGYVADMQNTILRLLPATQTDIPTPAMAWFLPPPLASNTSENATTKPDTFLAQFATTSTPIAPLPSPIATAIPTKIPLVTATELVLRSGSRVNITPTATLQKPSTTPSPQPTATSTPIPTLIPTIAPTSTPISIQNKTAGAYPASFRLSNVRHEAQTMNNCGPATVAMQLSAFGRRETQSQIQPYLRPDKDDRNTSPNEMAAYAQTLGFRSRLIVGGTIPLLKELVANGMPPVVETWFIPHVNDEMGHYRLLIGYEDDTLIFFDSYNGPNIRIKEAEFDALWKVFNRTAIVVWTRPQNDLAQNILEWYMDDRAMYENAMRVARNEVTANNQDKYAWFNLGTNLVAIGDTANAVKAYNSARRLNLPWRMLWYQFGPYQAYFAEKQYDEVIRLANATLSIVNNLEESYYWRGRAYAGLGNVDQARRDFNTALRLNSNFVAAKEALP